MASVWPGSSAAGTTKPDAEYASVHSQRAQVDMAGSKRAYDGRETSTPKMRLPPTQEETEAKARATYPTGSIQRMPNSYSGAVTRTSSPRSVKVVNAPAKAEVSNYGARDAPQVGMDSFWLPGSKAINLQRNISQAPEDYTAQRFRSSQYDNQRRPAPPPPAARSESPYGPARDNQSMENEIERLKKDLAFANEQLVACQRDKESLIVQRKRAEEKLQVEKRTTAATIQEKDGAAHRAREDVQYLERELKKGVADNKSLQRELEHLKGSTNNTRALEAKVRESESALASTIHDLEITKNELRAMGEQKTQLDSLLKDRTFELKGAQSFLTTADTSSGADVISMLQRLNSEILQSSAYMAEAMVDAFSFQAGGVRDETACGIVAESCGKSLAHFLATKTHKNDPLLIQITFQSCLVKFLEFVICSWKLPNSDDTNSIFTKTYERIRFGGEFSQYISCCACDDTCDPEAQAVSGRWRALTAAYTPSYEESQLIAQVTPFLAGRFANIMLAAGCSASPDALRASAEKKLSDRIVLLFKMATQLKKIVMEEITSADLRTVIVSGGVVYSAEEMEDAYVDGDPATDGVRVLCTTDLGLSRTTKLATSGEKQWDNKLLLKPKVALETVVDSMDE